MKARVANIRPTRHSTTPAPALHGWVPTARRLVLVDIENVVGGAGGSAGLVSTALHNLRRAIKPSDRDVWVTACGPTLLTEAMGVFTSRVLLGRGENGADNRQLEYLEPDAVVGRYSSVVLVSGDSVAFAVPVRELARLGVPTDVYLGAGFIGADLYRAARSVTTTARDAESAAAPADHREVVAKQVTPDGRASV